MNVKIEQTWQEKLSDQFEEPYFKELASFVKESYLQGTVYPPPKLVFNAFKLCPFDKVKVVILGQDPYHTPGQAHGLCFSVAEGVQTPPSLNNIYKEIYDDLGLPIPKHGNLEHWARQGVLLLNATLTVQARTPMSHYGKGWEKFTDSVIKKLSDEKENLVFLLWGKSAREKGAVVDESKHLVLQSPHPSPFSAHSGFFGCKHFSQTNNYLKLVGTKPIRWV